MPQTADQVAAIPMRRTKNGLRILMVTSRESRRWVLPKGWTMDGKTPWRAAEIEALEEAGVKGYIANDILGIYHYDKRMDDGTTVQCRVRAYPMMVDKVKRNWKERRERKRRWFSPMGAAQAVDEPALAELLRSLDRKPKKQPVIRKLLKAS